MTSRDPNLRLPSWLIAASLVVLVVATLTYFITSNNDNTDEAAPPATPPADTGGTPDESTPSDDGDQQQPVKDDAAEKADEDDKSDADSGKPAEKQKPKKQPTKQKPEKPEPTPAATVDVYNNSGITNLAASVSSDVQAVGFTVGGVDNWYGSIPESTIYYPSGMEEQAQLLAGDLGVSRMMPAISPMSTERLSLILTAAI